MEPMNGDRRIGGGQPPAAGDATLDLRELAGVAFREGYNKPQFDTITRCLVTNVEAKVGRQMTDAAPGGKPTADRDYTPIYLQVTMVPEGTSDEFWENFGGIRLYRRADGVRELWSGKDSAGALLRKVIGDQFGEQIASSLIYMISHLNGQTVGVKSEKSQAFGGGESHKNLIKVIYTKNPPKLPEPRPQAPTAQPGVGSRPGGGYGPEQGVSHPPVEQVNIKV